MSRMAADFFAQSPVLALPILALLIFSAVFVAVVLRTARAPKDAIDARARLPLMEDGDV